MGALRNLRENLTGVLAILILGLGLADLWIPTLVPGVPFWAIFAIGYAVVLPLVAIVLGEDEDDSGADRSGSGEHERVKEDDAEPPLERLKRRYAEGELDDEEFERRLERLLETEDESAAADYLRRERSTREREEA